MRTALVAAAVVSFAGIAVVDALARDWKTAAASAMLAAVNGLLLA